MKQIVFVTGYGTDGSFALNHGPWTTGRIPVRSDNQELQTALEEIPPLMHNVLVTGKESHKKLGPKSWSVQIPDELGPLWLMPRGESSMGLFGWASSGLILLDGDHKYDEMVSSADCDENGYCLDCGSATVHKPACVTQRADRAEL